MKILAFGTSNNRESINRSLASYAAGLVASAEVEILNINDYEMPLFSDEREHAPGATTTGQGIPAENRRSRCVGSFLR